MGHAGTLDPMATGLLIIGIGEGTKKLTEYLKLPKTYEAKILLGRRTDTGDIEGKILEEKPITSIDEKMVRRTLSSMVGVLDLPVPAYSAIKQEGVPLYKKARRGEAVEAPVREMKITSATYCDITPYPEGCLVVRAVFEVSSGTYVRSLAEEFGRRLGVPATLAELRRTQIGEFRIEGAKKLEDF